MSTLRPPTTSHTDVLIRRAFPDDRAALERLAALDGKRPPAGPALLAEEGGELRAALDLELGAVIADPFRATEHLAALLRLQGARAQEPSQAERRGVRAALRAVLGPTMPLGHRAA